MVSCGYEVLDRAIAGRMGGVLTAPADAQPEWQVRFLAYDAELEGIWVEPLDESCQPLDPLIAAGSQVQAAIGIDHNRYAFSTRIDRREMHFWLTESTMVEAILLGGPIELFVAERRACPRYLVPDTSGTLAQLTFRSALTPLRVRPWDISAGGVSFLCPRDAAALKLKRDDLVSFTLNHRGGAIAGKANVRFTRLLSDRVLKFGAKFIPDSLDAASQKSLGLFLADMARLARSRKSR
ncbi:MAG TPA: hypothetical protein VK797_05425 [Tepidisphaeraceae bacterium]|jgi:hypothetical protein|nr:hypothetical protein [Tepidisphaeraceae bacterium]